VELRHGLWDFVREINAQGTTILLTTHYLEEAEQMCDRIAIMNHGTLIAMEATRALVRRLSRRRVRICLEQPLERIPDRLDIYQPRLEDEGRELLLNLPVDGTAGALLGELCGLGLAIRDLETQQSSLEEVFLQLTGIDETLRNSKDAR
jgi:ABC-2 type transport system ATP-binding protein